MMVEELWESMGSLEHAWFERFIPDVHQQYPLETQWVTPWNAAIAVKHYGLVPTLNHRLLHHMGPDDRMASLTSAIPTWLDLRSQAGLVTDCWQLTHEIVQSFHSRDHLPEHLRFPYSVNVDANAMARLQMLCPSSDWSLSLACAGMNALELNDAVKAGTANEVQETAVAWLHWWLDKSPNCMDNLAWADFPMPDEHAPKTPASTQMYFDLLAYAQDARDTFPMARALYNPSSGAAQMFMLPSMEP